MNLVTIYLTDICNLNCEYCVSQKWLTDIPLKKYDWSTAIDVDKLISYMKKHFPSNEWFVEIGGGGEPTLHPDFNKFLDLLFEAGYKGLIRTNGTKKIPREKNFKIMTTWHYSHKTTPIEMGDITVIFRYEHDNWEEKFQYCKDNNISYIVADVFNVHKFEDSTVKIPILEKISNFTPALCDDWVDREGFDINIEKLNIIYPNGAIVGCNKCTASKCYKDARNRKSINRERQGDHIYYTSDRPPESRYACFGCPTTGCFQYDVQHYFKSLKGE